MKGENDVKKNLKRMLCSILAVICLLHCSVYAASDTAKIESRLAQIIQTDKYKPGASGFGAGGCWVFVNSVSNVLFGINIPSGTNGKYKLVGALGYWSCISYAYDGSATNEAVAQVLRASRAGDIIQYRCAWTDSQHTAMIYSNNGKTVTLYDFANSKVLKRDVVLNDLPGTIGNFGGITSYGITLYRCNHSVSTTPISTGGGDPSITAVTKGYDGVTETEAILRGEVKASGGRITECGMYIGTSERDLELLGSDKNLNTSGTACYYSTSKYGYPLQPGTRYYYQVYAVAGGKAEKGVVKSFKTVGVAPTPTPTPTLTPTPTPTLTPTPTPAAKPYQAYIDTTGMEGQAKYCERMVDKEGNIRKINAVYLHDRKGKQTGSLKQGDAVTAEPGNTLPVKGTDDILIYVTSSAGKGYVWDAYLSDTKPAPEPIKSYKAYIDISSAAPEYRYCGTVVDERTEKVIEATAGAFYKSGGVSAEFKQGDAVTVQPDDWMYGGEDTDDVLVYVTSNRGSGYVWDAYLSKEKAPDITPPETASPAPADPVTPPETSTPSPEPEPPVPETPTPAPEPETPDPVPETPEPKPITKPETPRIWLSSGAGKVGGSITVRWEPDETVSTYNLFYLKPSSRNEIFSWYDTVVIWDNVSGFYTISDLEAGEYKVRLKAMNEAGEAESEEISFIVK